MIPKVAVILTDPSRNIIWVNQDFSDITGYSLREVIGKKPSLLQGARSETSTIARMRRCLEEQIPFKDAITNYRKNGEEYLCKLVIYPIFNEDHQLLHFIAFEIDGDEVKDESKIPLMQLSEKYTSSSLRGVDEMKLYYQLQKLLEDEKLYLDPDLSLRQLADSLATNTKYLSQVVNHLAGSNFQYYLNTFRIKEVQGKILNAEYKNLTLFGIALQCGFKNKSTFYKVFKEIIGMTPKEYIKQSSQRN
ncbi:MAG: PAS domain-containing protein [Bacteroidota bacterium]